MPRLRRASKFAPRAMKVTSSPASASRSLSILSVGGQGRECVPGPTRSRQPASITNSNKTLELVVQARGDADLMASAPGRRSGAAVVGEHGVRAVVAIRGHAAAAGAEVVVSIAVIDGVRRIQIPVQALVEAVLPGN